MIAKRKGIVDKYRQTCRFLSTKITQSSQSICGSGKQRHPVKLDI